MRWALGFVAAALCAGDPAPAQPLVAPPPAIAAAAAPVAMIVSPWLAQGWEDGLAEVAEYDLDQVRYGTRHRGEAVLVAIREAMDPERGVKAAGGAGEPVLKLHWTRRFTTGAYAYDQSSFQLVRRADGALCRWLITSQEWCGAAAKSWQPGGPLRVASYFDGHGDLAQPLALAAGDVPADSLWWWARAWTAGGGTAAAMRIVPGQIEARCVATIAAPASAVCARAAGATAAVVTVQRDRLVDRLHLGPGPAWPLLRWEQADGSVMTLRRMRRFAYWAR